MPLQDLTPQLRTRLNKMERAVGWFVFFATVLLFAGFGYYIYHAAERKGWFKIKAPFFTYVQSSTGLSRGDPVVMMGFQVGEITKITPMPPRDTHNVRVDFDIQDNYFRYIWTGGSVVKLNSGFLEKRQLEVTRGTNGYAIVVTQPVSIHTLDEAKSLAAAAPGHWQLSQDILDSGSNIVFRAYAHLEQILNETNAALLASSLNIESNSIYIYDNTVNRSEIVASWDGRKHRYKIFVPGDETAWLRSLETPPVADQLQRVVSDVQAALPNILALTNKLFAVLDNAANATSNLNVTIVSTQPLLTNFAAISGDLRGPGALGAWVLGTNAPYQLELALTNANILLTSVNTNVDELTDQIGRTLENVANITSNLNVQVEANSNLLWGISKTITDTDSFIQGLKHHWLLRSAFKAKPTNAPPAKTQPPTKTK